MKLTMKKYIYILLAGVMFASCDDYLSKTPDNRAELDTKEAIKQLLVTAYPEYTYVPFAEVMSDNAGDKGSAIDYFAANLLVSSIRSNREAYAWEIITDEAQDSPNGYWNGCYNAIAAANHALEAIDNYEGAEDLSAQRGEALLCRAYAHFMLVNLWGKQYDPSDVTSLGVPYVTEPEKTMYQPYSRNTVAEVYNLIGKDLEMGLPLIKDSEYSVPKYHFNRAAAYTFASRYYLFINKPELAIQAATIALGTEPSKLLRDWNGSYTPLADEDEVSIKYGQTKENANFLVMGCVSWEGRAFSYHYGTTYDVLMGMLNSTTVANMSGTRNWAFKTLSNSSYGVAWIFKFHEFMKRESVNANYGYGYVVYPVLTAEEALLNRAEAYAMLGTDEGRTKCVQDMNSYYSKRIQNYDPVKNNVTAASVLRLYGAEAGDLEPDPFYTIPEESKPYIRCLLAMRKLEFVQEGHRWFDLRRFNLPVIHKYEDGREIRLEKNDVRRQLEIPSDAIEFGLQPNRPMEHPSSEIVNESENWLIDGRGDAVEFVK